MGGEGDGRAALRVRDRCELGADGLRAAMHGSAARGRQGRVGRADAVVGDLEAHASGRLGEGDGDLRAARVTHRVGERLGGDAVACAATSGGRAGRRPATSIRATPARVSSVARSRSSSSTGRPSSGARSSATLVSMSAVVARSSDSARPAAVVVGVEAAVVQRGEHQVRGVHAAWPESCNSHAMRWRSACSASRSDSARAVRRRSSSTLE